MYHIYSCIKMQKYQKKSLCEIMRFYFISTFGHCNMLWRRMKTSWYEMWWYCTWNTKTLSGIFENAAFYNILGNLPAKRVSTRILGIFCYPTLIFFHIFSTSDLNNLLDILVLKYAHGLVKPKNDDKKVKYHSYDLHIAFTLIFSLILWLATLILGFWVWQVCLQALRSPGCFQP